MVANTVRTYFVPVLILAMGFLLSASTLHSHQHLELDHPPQAAETGHCLIESLPLCPICAQITKSDVLTTATTTGFFEILQTVSIAPRDRHHFIYRPSTLGRSPPSIRS